MPATTRKPAMAVTTTVISIIKAIIVRILFILHGFIVIWRVADIHHDWRFLAMAASLVLLVIETIFAAIKRKGRDWKWISPCILIYLMCVVPGVWILETDRLHRKRMNNTEAHNGSEYNVLPPQDTAQELSSLEGIRIPLKLTAELWRYLLEQSLLFLLVLGRWLLPKGKLSRSQLSELLLMYIGSASDIMDLFSLFEEESVLKNRMLEKIILAAWCNSLLQFALVLTATRRSNVDRPRGPCYTAWCYTNMWSFFAMIILQDGPFLAIRVFVVVKLKSFNYTIFFFTLKNAMVVALYIYSVLCSVLEVDPNERKVGTISSNVEKEEEIVLQGIE